MRQGRVADKGATTERSQERGVGEGDCMQVGLDGLIDHGGRQYIYCIVEGVQEAGGWRFRTEIRST